jgi:rfaE bifunctional protein nucleotidyltransferase chain/domain
MKDNLEPYGFFDFRDNPSVNVEGVTMCMKKVNILDTFPSNTHVVLVEGSVYENNQLLKEGSMLFNNHTYFTIEPVTILLITKKDWKEDCKVIYGLEHLQIIGKNIKTQRKSIILTSGCYDVLHVGHLHTLKEAKTLGDKLIVCLSSDEQIRALKGETRPINKFEDRLNLFKTIECVDYIIPYQEEYIETEETLGKIMKILDPDVWVKGSDYTVQKILEKHPYLRHIHLVPLIENTSTTNIIKKISAHLK